MPDIMNTILFLVIVLIALSSGQFFPNDIVNEDVQRVSANEALLPPHLKNPFYQNPWIRDALAKQSWFGPGEKLVKSRDTHRIPRKEIYLLLKHAGFLPQQRHNNY